MAITNKKFRVIQDTSIYNNSNSSKYGDETLMIDRGGAYI